MKTIYLIKYAEIGVKGKNRYVFEDALVKQIRFALKGIGWEFEVKRAQGRIYIDAKEGMDADTDEEETTSSFNTTALWYAIPTAILAVSLILAIIAYLMKKVKIKKWEKRRINQYDRERTVHRDVIRAEAETRRNAQVKELNEQIKHCEEEIAKIDDIRSKRQGTRRSENLGKITRSAEREFKQFAKRRTAIENRIIMLNKQIDNMNTAEYLLSVQHKIAVEKARAEREAREKSFIKQKKEKTSKKK